VPLGKKILSRKSRWENFRRTCGEKASQLKMVQYCKSVITSTLKKDGAISEKIAVFFCLSLLMHPN
jgi:hypothetical protein